ncbi:neurotrophin-3 [Synchiropus splendidus]|uniref:neurotrophin-3 n=1 Tax=Synchiropus splendidus TaxID=270530 RepID=UPI00237E58E6|nr:neurotrophin-3 [Synchiropus splendidus]XP_053707089.1 neurotrophin-3 [Synchiropus splendidus]
MHWLPLVAMVIASALPFPQSPVSRIAAATTEPGFVERRHDRASSLMERPSSELSRGATSQTDYDPAEKLRDDGSENPGALRSTSEGNMFLDLNSRDPQGHTEDWRESLASPATQSKSTAIPAAGAQAEPISDPRTMDDGLWLDNTILEGGGMFLDAHPRVLFSPSPSPPKHPPLLLMLESGLLEEDGEDIDGHIEGHGDRATDRTGWAESSRALRRDKRSEIDRRRGERSVCDSESGWVTDKVTATDSYGQNVTILKKIQTQTGQINQYFFETRCRQAQPAGDGNRVAAAARSPEMGVAGAGCLGVDKKQWVSQCKEKHSFVRALTKDANNRVGWRWIRIDSSCVCVLLSRANRTPAREVLTRRGRG